MKGWREQFFYTSVGVGMAMATSAFTMISGLYAVASLLWILGGILLAGVFCMLVSFSIGELASMFPSAPGLRTYFKAAFGDSTSLILVYLYLIFAILIAGLESFIFSQVLQVLVPTAAPTLTVAILLTAVVCINLAGFELPRSLQIGASVATVLLILGSAVFALLRARISFSSMFNGAGGGSITMLPAVAGMGIFLFTGFEWVTPLGLRPKSYQRRLPLSMPVAVLVLMLAYCAFVAGASSQLPPKALQDTLTPQVPYFQSLYGSWGSYLALALSMLAIFSTFNAGILGGSQLIYLLGREGNLPKWSTILSLRTGCPVGAILCLGVLAGIVSIIVMTFHLEIVAALVGSAIMCVIYAGFIGSAIRLRSTRPQAARPFRNATPKVVQVLLLVIFLVIGVQTLFSEPGKSVVACLGVVVSFCFAWALASWSAASRGRLMQIAKAQASGD